MQDINKTQANIDEIKEFVKHLENNYKEHSKNAKESQRLDDLENSVLFLKDYLEVSNELVEVIKAYKKKVGLD